jgi:hypothetical protein
MMSPIASRSDLDAAKDRLLLPELWRILNLAGEPPTRDRVKFSSPLRPDAHPSCSFYDGCRRMRDWSTGKDYDAVDFLGEALGLKNGEAIRRFLEIANGSPVALDYVPTVRPQPKAKAERPVLSGFAKATRIEAQRIAPVFSRFRARVRARVRRPGADRAFRDKAVVVHACNYLTTLSKKIPFL